MILCNLFNELGDLVPEGKKKKHIHVCVNEIFDLFWDEKRGVILENISLEGSFSRHF